jgi:hypothetical protein
MCIKLTTSVMCLVQRQKGTNCTSGQETRLGYVTSVLHFLKKDKSVVSIGNK